MSQRTNAEYLRNEQYQDASNLNARIQLHQRFSTNQTNWFRWVFDHFVVSREAHILELGCGPGKLWMNNLDRIHPELHIYLSDFSIGMLREAYQNTHSANFVEKYIVVDAQEIPFPAASFDFVIANHMLYHVPDRSSAIKEIHRVLRSGGQLIAATNGINHMSEIRVLLSRLDPSLTVHTDYAFGVSEFTLENGAAQLANYFSKVQTNQFPGNLEVTRAEPLLAYLHSMITTSKDKFTDQDWMGLRQIIDQEISKTGSFHISKSTGIFVAEKSS